MALSSPSTPADAGLPNFGEVRPGVLYRGGQPRVDRKAGVDGYRDLIDKYKVKTVVDLMNEPIDHWILQKRGDCDRMTSDQKQAVRYVRFASYEAFPRRRTLAAFLRILNDPDNLPVFVHCADGANRTGAIIGGYRIVKDGWQPTDADAEMTNFGVLSIWKGVNERFIEDVARDRDGIRKEDGAQTIPGSIQAWGKCAQ